ncbi:MAG: hypothetical protein Q9P44_13880 [Anaerolineae bacterium]|nr:hypothetical protein [Anaerolineae bacterium]
MNIRLTATRYIWVAYSLTMIALFISSTQNGGSLGAEHVLVALAASIMAFLSTGTVWSWGKVGAEETMVEHDETKKRKHRSKMDKIVSRLSDDEREELRERLADEIVHYDVGDDGELVSYR